MATSTTNSSRKLDGKVAIVTGGASGIGEASVRLFVKHGALVVIGDIQDDQGLRLVDELGPHLVAYRHCNVCIEEDVEALVAFAVEKWGKLNIMFNNAGVLGKTASDDVIDVDMAEFDYINSVNVRGMVLGIKHAGKAMVDAKIKGSVICTASIAGIKGGIGPTAYIVSKHATIGLMHAACGSLSKYGIRVNCVSPTVVATPLTVAFFRDALSNPSLSMEDVQEISDGQYKKLAGHSLSVWDVAHAALYLASDDSNPITGHNLVVDGGYSSVFS